MAASSKVTFNQKGLRTVSANQQKALRMATDAVLTDVRTSQTIPFDQGTMQNDQTSANYDNVAMGQASIGTSAPQANRLYFHPEYNFQTVNNPKAGAGWFDPYITGSKRNLALQNYTKFLRQLNGG